MRPTLTSRFAGSALAFAFLASGAGDAFGVHACPHHDVLPAVADEAAAVHVRVARTDLHRRGGYETGEPAGHGSHAGSHQRGAPQPGSAASAGHHDFTAGGAGHSHESSACTCLGHCDTSSGQAHPTTVARESSRTGVRVQVALPAAFAAPFRHVAYLLPWSTAPPSLR